MTSKEALEKYYSNLLYGNGGFQTDEEELEALNTIKQDLEAYEQLKQDHDKTLINNGELCVKVCKLEKENEDLKYKLYKIQPLEEENRRMFGEIQKIQKELGTEKWKSIQFLEDFKKHKIAIDILKSNLCIEFNDNYNGVKFKLNKYDECDYTVLCLNLKSQYDLLKEVLEHEQRTDNK